MKKKLLPLKNIILYLIGTFGLCIIIVCIYSVRSYSELLINTLRNNQELYSRYVLQSTEKNLNDIQNIASSIAYNQSVQRYLVTTDTEKKFTLYQQIINLLNNTKSLNNSILDISLIGETNNSANLVGDISLYQSFYNSIPDYGGAPIHFLDKSSLIIDGTNYDCQIVAFPIYKLSTTSSKFIGVLFVTINSSTILGDYLYDENIVPTELMFVNSNNQLIFGEEGLYNEIQELNTRKDTFSLKYNNQTYMCRQFQVNAADGMIYTFVNKSIYIKKIARTLLPQFLLLLVIFLIVITMFLIFSGRITGFFRQLTSIMDEISTGKQKAMHERLPDDPKRNSCLEIALIATSFNDMMDEINRLNHDIFNSYTKMYELEMSKRKAELAYLRSQINPHFLYNTLTLICGMASENNSNGIIDITQALSRIYRYSLGNDIVTVRQELEIIKAYVTIQITRFEDRFTVHYDFTEDVLDAYIPRMIIQPLVENAVKHGLEKSLKKGDLTIGGRHNILKDTLCLWVYDTGVGMTGERLAYVRQILENSAEASRDFSKPKDSQTESNIGLYNVNSRIRLCYGEPYHLHIDSEEGIGTNLQIEIPFRTK
jgi:Predicted signal transduction protein with a C-terminal ATPase domain